MQAIGGKSMPDELELQSIPKAADLSMIVGWRQWADAGAVSSGLPQYLVQQTNAKKIGTIRPDGFYIFQVPGTHDLVRPGVKFTEGYPELLDTPENELYYAGDEKHGVVFLIGDEPHLDIERYTATVLRAARQFGARRIIGLGGVYGEVPYDKERLVTGIYSLHKMKDELVRLAISLSDYEGGASIGSYLCKRAGENGMEYMGMYAIVPAYDFSGGEEVGNSLRLENDFGAWLSITRRLNYILKLDLDLTDLEERNKELIRVVESKVDEVDQAAPQLGIRDTINRVSEEFSEVTFNPLDDVWEEELKRLTDKFDLDET
jgi:proteasome assembly chaperone (PAC2) family protein